MKIKKNVQASKQTNFRTGGKVAYLVEVNIKKDLVAALKYSDEKEKEWKVIGLGTNMLISDYYQDIVLIRLNNKNMKLQNNLLSVGAGVVWDELVVFAIKNNLAGFACMSGIPGTVGAAPIQNIGAYGQEIAEVIDYVEVYDTKVKVFKKLLHSACKFKYRDSIFKHTNRYIVYQVGFRSKNAETIKIEYDALKAELKGKEVTLSSVRSAVLNIRKHKFGSLKGIGTAGSFFKNPVVDKIKFDETIRRCPNMPYFKSGNNYKLYGGWLIEKAGFKGFKYKRVGVSDNNALILKNLGGASSEEVYSLATKIKEKVYELFDIMLEPEVDLVGFK